MTNYAPDTGCDAGQHADDMRAFDRLPPPIRDRLRRARDNLCAGCVRLMLRRSGLEATGAAGRRGTFNGGG